MRANAYAILAPNVIDNKAAPSDTTKLLRTNPAKPMLCVGRISIFSKTSRENFWGIKENSVGALRIDASNASLTALQMGNNVKQSNARMNRFERIDPILVL
jgi:hypothetical protein